MSSISLILSSPCVSVFSRCAVSPKEIEQLYHRFKKLDRSRTGVISRMDFQLISELSLNPMSQRILSLFQTEGGDDALSSTLGGVTFDCFVKTLNLFNARTSPREKMDALFRAYDCDGDGRVSQKDLRAMLRYYVGPHLDEVTLRVMVRNTMQHALQRCAEMGICGEDQPANKEAAVKRAAASVASSRNNTDSASSAVESTSLPCEEARGLNFEQFSATIGFETLESLVVEIPIRDE